MKAIEDFFRLCWNSFSSSWFNFPLIICAMFYIGALFFYSKKRLIKPVRVINFLLILLLALCAFIGWFRGYNFVWDMQDKLYIGFIILFLLSIFLDKILKKHSDIEKIIVLSILFFILFISVNKLEILEYLIAVTFLLILLHINYSVANNRKFFLFSYVCFLLNMIEFYFIKCDENKFFIDNKILVITYIVYFLYFLISSVVLLICKEKNFQNDDIKNLFSERKYDLERVKEYLERYNLVGVDSIWGDGKSFLFKMLQNELHDKYHFICISVLSMQVEKVENFVLGEIAKLLDENRIYSTASKKIKGLLKQSYNQKLWIA